MSFDTALAICGPLRRPRQMLANQEYGGHTSIHDDAMADKLAKESMSRGARPVGGSPRFPSVLLQTTPTCQSAEFSAGCAEPWSRAAGRLLSWRSWR